MQIQVHVDNQIPGNKELMTQAEEILEGALERFSSRITTAIVHFNDVNSSIKSGENDKKCTLEVRPAGLDPIAVTAQAPQAEQALDSAVDTMIKTLDRTLGKLNDPRANMPKQDPAGALANDTSDE